MFAIVIRNYTRNKQRGFKAQSHTQRLGYELCWGKLAARHQLLSPSVTCRWCAGRISHKKKPQT